MFVGAPLCSRSFSGSYTPLAALIHIFPGRDRDYVNLNLAFAVNVMKFSRIISWVPKPLKLWVAPLYSDLHVSLSIKR